MSGVSFSELGDGRISKWKRHWFKIKTIITSTFLQTLWNMRNHEYFALQTFVPLLKSIDLGRQKVNVCIFLKSVIYSDFSKIYVQSIYDINWPSDHLGWNSVRGAGPVCDLLRQFDVQVQYSDRLEICSVKLTPDILRRT